MIDWIRKQLDYRAKYFAALDASREASANALAVMGRYEYLCTNLPYEHELSTRRHWEEHADRRLWGEHQALKRDYKHMREAHKAMVRQWEENLEKFGFAMYADWKLLHRAPKDGSIILAFGRDGENLRYEIVAWGGNDWESSDGKPVTDLTHWVHIPEEPK